MALDSNLLLINSAANVTATVTGTGVALGVDKVPQVIRADVPGTVNAADSLKITIEESDDNVTFTPLGTFPTINAIGQYFMTVMSNAVYRRAVLTVAGGAPNFGKVIVAPVPGGRFTNF